MLQESLIEMFLVAKYCVEFKKDRAIWRSNGCYGYSAAVLLFAIADSIGSYVIGGHTKKHFDILKHTNYYSLKLTEPQLSDIYKKFRCLLTHHSVLGRNVIMDIGTETASVFEFNENRITLNILPFLMITKIAVNNFLNEADHIVPVSAPLKEILQK